jgi:DNA-binding HxlR family transcriptional regulator
MRYIDIQGYTHNCGAKIMNPNNSSYKQYNQQLIIIALLDGQWHRNMEIKKETKLSPRTLSKHLNDLEKKLHWIERKEDTESGEYPHPVLYRANDTTVSYATLIKSIFDNADQIEIYLKETKDPLQILEDFHKANQYYFTLFLETIQKNKHTTQKLLDYMTSLFLYTPYKIYTTQLITAFAKAVQFGTQFDIDQLKQKHNVCTRAVL